jgi:cell pole-organizing protein PopZ
MSASAKPQQEPSMEEILASIRKIIADDDKAPASGQAQTIDATPADDEGSSQDDIDALLAAFDAQNDAVSEMTEPQDDVMELQPEEDVLELADMEDDAESSGMDDIEFREVMEEDVVPAPVMTTKPSMSSVAMDTAASSMMMMDQDILSSRTGAAVQNAFQSLAHTILTQNARTLEDLVAEMLRPMLKNWLDDNLPTLVERLIRAEIERIARGGRV